MLRREAREQIGRNDRGVAERLVKIIHDVRQQRVRLANVQHVHMMIRPQNFGDLIRVARFVVRRLIKANRERLHFRRRFAGQCRDRAGIHAAAQENADRHVAAQQAHAHRFAEQLQQFLDIAFFRHVCDGVFRNRNVPIFFDAHVMALN